MDEIFGNEKSMKGRDTDDEDDDDGDEFDKLVASGGDLGGGVDTRARGIFVGFGIFHGGHGLEATHRGNGKILRKVDKWFEAGGVKECKSVKVGGGGVRRAAERLSTMASAPDTESGTRNGIASVRATTILR